MEYAFMTASIKKTFLFSRCGLDAKKYFKWNENSLKLIYEQKYPAVSQKQQVKVW